MCSLHLFVLIAVGLLAPIQSFVTSRPSIGAALPESRSAEYANDQPTALSALGDFAVDLEKPLGIILEERGAGGGVYVKSINTEGSAASSNIVPGDVLLQVDDTRLDDWEFDRVMEHLIDAPPSVHLVLGDGLGQLNMPKNVVSTLQSTEDAYFVDAVVRQAVRELRRDGRLGDVLQVEVVVGAGVQESGTRGLCRFFALFSTDGGITTYSCNCSATGIRKRQPSSDDGVDHSAADIEIVYLSCAKDEGLGQTVDLIQKEQNVDK